MKDGEQPLLSQDQHPISRRWAVFEDDGVSAWLYLTEAGQMRPVGDCWIYNRVAAPPASEIQAYHGGPPPACLGYADPGAHYTAAEPPQVTFRWSPDGESVVVIVDGAALGFITAGLTAGFSRYLLQVGPWGSPWDEQRYQGIFGGDTAREQDAPPDAL